MLLLAAAFAAAAPASSAFAAQDKRAEELKAIEKRLRDKAAEEKRLKSEAEAREKEVAALRYRLIETANSLQAAEKRMAEIALELERINGEEKLLAETLKAQQMNLGDVLAALQSLERSRPPALLVSPDDANKAARAAMLLADAAPALEERAGVLRADLDRLAELRAERARERAAYEKTNDEIADRRRILAELLEKKQEERDVAASLAAAAQRETAALAARATSLREVIERLERLARIITPRLKPPAPKPDAPAIARAPETRTIQRGEAFRPARPFAEARGALKSPVAGRIVGAYGSPRPDGGRFDGVRFAAADQSIVTAPYEGNVAFARAWGPVGNLIVLDVGSGYHILLIGVSAFLVEEGQRVSAGEPLGLVASAEPGEEANLDFEIRKYGEPVNPSLWLARNKSGQTGY